MSRTLTMAASLLAAALLAAGSFYLGRHTGPPPASSTATTLEGRKVLYWHDPMIPGPRFDQAGKSPFMDMQLVPMYADSVTGAADEGGVKISPLVQQNLGIRYASVRRTETSTSFDAVGFVQFDERLKTGVQTRVAGYIERLLVRAPMERVQKGQALATIFAPDWLGPQNEWLALQRSGASADLIAAARERMRAMSIPAELIRRSEDTGTAQARYTLVAPVAGVVTELGVSQGVAVTPGMVLFRIIGLEKVWAVAEIPEAQAIHLARGQKVRAILQVDTSQEFNGKLDEILPEINPSTRTLKARFEVDNRSGKLTPGMLLRVQVIGPSSIRLVVPSEAVIRTGKRTVVFVRRADGSFEPRDVALGADRGDDTEVISGLSEGDQAITSGQFLVDSEARLRTVLGNMTTAQPPPLPGASAASPTGVVHSAQGKVEKIDSDGITISHGPVASLQWPSMTMGFAKQVPNAFPDIRPGDTVRFEFKEGGPMGYELLAMQRVQPVAKP